MLTPVEIQSKVFKSGGLGYDKKDVDNYMKDILRSYEDVYRENMELKDKLTVLNDGIQYYKTIEKTLQKALVLAEKTAEETKSSALKEAKRIEKEATVKAGIMLSDAKNELESLHQQTVTLIQQYEKYKAQFKNLAAAQLDLLNSDAFSINVQNLDAFVSNPVSFGQDDKKSASESVERITEISSEDRSVSGSAHLSGLDSEEQEFDFSDYDVAGQEEFDFVDLNDSE